MGIFVIIYILVGIVEYFKVQEEYRKKIQDDFPFHEPIIIEISLWIVCLLFTFPLHIMKLYYNIKQFFKNLWKKITFPFKLRKFAKKLEDVSNEKDSKKSVEMLFDAMRDILD
jgi:hypothetical protein|tara:strand:- start:8291 stop:8629 length:339 start_codon:yes stop_codon:yes gene_type:complete